MKAEKFNFLIVNMIYSIFNARQHAMLLYAERDIVMANPSVDLSVHLSARPAHSGIAFKRMTYRQTLSTLCKGMTLFERYRRYKIPRALKTRGGKFLQLSTDIAVLVFISETVRDRPTVTTDRTRSHM